MPLTAEQNPIAADLVVPLLYHPETSSASVRAIGNAGSFSTAPARSKILGSVYTFIVNRISAVTHQAHGDTRSNASLGQQTAVSVTERMEIRSAAVRILKGDSGFCQIPLVRIHRRQGAANRCRIVRVATRFFQQFGQIVS
jgi:hypothetical protein